MVWMASAIMERMIMIMSEGYNYNAEHLKLFLVAGYSQIEYI